MNPPIPTDSRPLSTNVTDVQKSDDKKQPTCDEAVPGRPKHECTCVFVAAASAEHDVRKRYGTSYIMESINLVRQLRQSEREL